MDKDNFTNACYSLWHRAVTTDAVFSVPHAPSHMLVKSVYKTPQQTPHSHLCEWQLVGSASKFTVSDAYESKLDQVTHWNAGRGTELFGQSQYSRLWWIRLYILGLANTTYPQLTSRIEHSTTTYLYYCSQLRYDLRLTILQHQFTLCTTTINVNSGHKQRNINSLILHNDRWNVCHWSTSHKQASNWVNL